MRHLVHTPYLATIGLILLMALPNNARAQGGDKAMQAQADALFEKGEYAQAYPMYSQLVSLSPQDHVLNYKFGACTLYGGDDKDKAIGYLKFAVTGPATPNLARYFLGRAYQLDYRFDDAITAYQHYRGTADKKLLAQFPVDAMEQQCRNGKYLLSNLKDIEVMNKVQVDAADFFRFYDLSDIGGKIVVTPDELLTNYDRKSGEPFLTYLPTGGGPIYFSSFGKDGKTGKDIYRSELLPTGGYASPMKIAGYINTAEDEAYAVMAPDGKTFYFCSKGHNSMGGYDVFKSTYDKGMDTFGAPENMDFAVNTPADELLYIVGPDGEQACFASDRDSKQGMLNVYRVGTTQTPINITVLKGTYASAFDPTDRRAHIIVEDALTRERVADVNTDMNGSYLLALPRGGKYKFLVEGGPGGLTHLETVDVPPNDRPKVYKQEVQLVEQGGEKVVIKNYFDQPLEDDVMALALNEIKRRAKLDVTGEKAVDQVTVQASRSDEPLQAAGFDGTMTMTKAQDLARKDADGSTALAVEQDRQANTAYDMALKNVTTAEAASKRARELVQQADRAEKVEEKDPIMRQAAEAKQLSQEANERARAAYRTAGELEAAGQATRTEAATAAALTAAIAQAQASGDRDMATTALKQLKARMDAKNGPEGQLDEAERTRRAATVAGSEASQKMRQATAQREEENLLAERIDRLKRDAANAKGRKKEEINGQLSVLDPQRSALHDEVEDAFEKAQDAEDHAALARGQAQLVRYLNGDKSAWKEDALPKNELAGMEQRLSDVRAENKALAIDERYAPLRSMSAEERERSTFDWGTNWSMADLLNGNYLAVSKSRTGVDAVQGEQADVLAVTSSQEVSQKSDGSAPTSGADQRQDALGTTVTGTSTSDATGNMTGNNTGTETRPENDDRSNSSVDTSTNEDLAMQADRPAANKIDKEQASSDRDTSVVGDGLSGNDPEGTNRNAENSAGNRSPGERAGTDGTLRAGNDTGSTAGADTKAPGTPIAGSASADSAKGGSSDQAAQNGDSSDGGKPLAGNNGTSVTDRKEDGTRELEGNTTNASNTSNVSNTDNAGNAANTGQHTSADADEQAFILANKLAELEQLRDGEKSRAKRDSLDQAITDQRKLIKTYQTDHTGTVAETTPVVVERNAPVDYKPLEFDLSILDEQLAEEAYPGFNLRKKEILDGPGDARDKANMLHALEMELVDSIDAQTAKNLTVLDQRPELADKILPRLERWRQLKSAHVDSAAAALAEVDKEYVASESRAMEDAQLSGQAIKQQPSNGNGQPATPHNDAYVTIASDLSQIYSSALEARSNKNREAVALKDRDLEQVAQKLAEVDSLEKVLQDTPGGKNYDKLRQRIDRKIDDVLIQNVELGQRMAFISNSEYDVAKDSAKVLEKAVSRMGLPPNEPLLQMVKSYVGAADDAMGKAKAFRKDADRTDDILKRNSLYRQAYGEELKALRDYDRSHTVRNYLLSGQAVPSAALTYEQVEELMFKPVLAAAPARNSGREDQKGNMEKPAGTAVDTLAEKPVDVVSVVPVNGGQDVAETDQANADLPGSVKSDRKTTGEAARPGGVPIASPIATQTDSSLLSKYLDNYYYLSPSERATVKGGDEERRYFLMKGSSMEDRAKADAASTEAEGAAQLATDLRTEVVSEQGSDGSSAAPDAEKRTGLLNTRADALMQRSDSLHRVADRLISKATSSDAQAAILMQGMPADRSAAIMDLEQGRRRTEPLLARTRPTPEAEAPGASNTDQAVVIADSTVPTSATPERTEDIGANAPETAPARVNAGAERISRVTPVVGNAPAPFTGPLVNDVFQFADAAPLREEPIPIDVPMPEGVVYKVQVGAFRNALPIEAFSDMTPVAGEHAGNGLVRYTAGMFTSADAASKAGAKVRARGYRDAFVVAYMDGKRVPLRDAMIAERQVAAAAPTAQVPVSAPASTTPRPTTTTTTTTAAVIPGTTAPVPASVPVPATVQVPQADAEAAVLAAYPSSAEEVLAEFKPAAGASEYYNDPTAAPAKQVEAVKGLFFTVQVGVYSKPTALDKLFNITPLNSELTANQKIRYTTGIFLDEGNAVTRKNGTVSLGVTDAFVTAYLNGKRIPVRDARALLAKFGRSVLVDPTLVTQ